MVGMHEVEIDLLEAADRAEQMVNGLEIKTLKSHEFASTMAVLIGTMSDEYGIDSMIMIQDIETILNTIEFE